jgi:NADPH-dependent 2,4-dienoyl-CoA reductase/sulfur reductase-like enzyme/rhodanese-related sulfurtransferase
MSNNHIVVIGGTACGPKAAARASRCDPSAKITIIEKNEGLSTATCGLPYYVSGIIESEDSMSVVGPDYFEDLMDAAVLIKTEAINVDRQAHNVSVKDLHTGRESRVEYDRLVLATGSVPSIPKLEGLDLKGIFTMNGLKDANAMREYLPSMKTRDIAVVGAGLIGLEMVEAFITCGFNVTLIEALDWPLPTLLDWDVAIHIEKHIREKGVNFLFGKRVSGFKGDERNRVNTVLVDGTEVNASLVLLALGVRPNTDLARDAGLAIGSAGGISVNEYLQTSDPDIYAGGDCVEVINLITGKTMLAPMGSTANKHGRIIGTNVTGGRETFPGVLGTAIVKVFDHNAGRVGLNEAQAQSAGYETVTALVPSNEHATYYPGSRELLLKLIAEKSTGKILGGEMAGPGDIAKRIDVLVTAISMEATVDQLANLDLAYAPPFNSAMDPLHNAANVIRNKRSGLGRSTTPADVERKIENGEDFILLDVRNHDEWDNIRIEAEQVKLLPLPELRRRFDEIDKNDEIITLCLTSIRAYQAQRILDGAGFKDVRFMDGSIRAWPYDLLESS